MNRLLLSMVLAGAASLGVTILTLDCASACSCAVPADSSPRRLVEESLSSSDAVFAGEVISIDEPSPISSSTAPARVTLRVSEVWKGPERETLSVETEASDTGCGYPFERGKSYLVYAQDGMEVALCGSTKPLSRARTDLRILGAANVQEGQHGVAGERLPETSGPVLGRLLPVVASLLGGVLVGTMLIATLIGSCRGR